MVGSTKTAIRNTDLPKVSRPPPGPGARQHMARQRRTSLPFERDVDFSDVAQSPIVPKRHSRLGQPFRPTFQKNTATPYDAFNNVLNK